MSMGETPDVTRVTNAIDGARRFAYTSSYDASTNVIEVNRSPVGNLIVSGWQNTMNALGAQTTGKVHGVLDEHGEAKLMEWLAENPRKRPPTAEEEIARLKAQAAEDIIWMSGIGTIPDEALDVWRAIQKRWLL